MPYSKASNTIFVHIPKTGGTSIEKAIGIYGRGNDANNAADCDELVFGDGKQHYTITEIAKHLSDRNINYDIGRSFAVLREPSARFVSHYRWTPKGASSGRSVERFFAEVFLPSLGDTDVEARHRWPQTAFVTDSDHRPSVRYLIEFSRFAEGYRQVVERLGLQPVSELEHHKRSDSADKGPALPEYIGQFIREFYGDDISLLSTFGGNALLETEPTSGLSLSGTAEHGVAIRNAAIASIDKLMSGSVDSRPFLYGLACLHFKSGQFALASSYLKQIPREQLTRRTRLLKWTLLLRRLTNAPLFDRLARRLINKV